MLVAKFMVRWWYAMQWPEVDVRNVPIGYEPMDGFQGVFLCTGDPRKLGDILDLRFSIYYVSIVNLLYIHINCTHVSILFRDHSTSPSFQNLVRKSSQELKELLVTACNNQVRNPCVYVFFFVYHSYHCYGCLVNSTQRSERRIG